MMSGGNPKREGGREGRGVAAGAWIGGLAAEVRRVTGPEGDAPREGWQGRLRVTRGRGGASTPGVKGAMIVVHHLNHSRSQRVLWLLEELGVEYEIVRYRRDPKTQLAPPELRAVHPLGKSPVITDEGSTVAESGAIIEYLVDRYGRGRLRPAAGTPEHLRYTYWLHYAEGSAMPALLLKLVVGRLAKAPALLRPVAKLLAAGMAKTYVDPHLNRHARYIDEELGRYPWFAGSEFSAADVQMSFVAEAVLARCEVASELRRLSHFVERIRARPAYQRALERGGPFEIVG